MQTLVADHTLDEYVHTTHYDDVNALSCHRCDYHHLCDYQFTAVIMHGSIVYAFLTVVFLLSAARWRSGPFG